MAVAEDLNIKGLTHNKTSTLAAGKLSSSSTRNSPLLRFALQDNQRDHAPPLKRSNMTQPPVPSTTDDTEIQEVIPELEPGEPSTPQHKFAPQSQVQANNVLTAEEEEVTSYQE